MDTLKFLAEYGLLDIFFGIGVLGFIYKLFIKVVPANLDELHVNADFPLQQQALFFVQLSNAGAKNIYISRAYFKPKKRRFFFFKNKYALTPEIRRNYTNLSQGFYELRFGENQKEYDILIKPGYENKAATGFGISTTPSSQSLGDGNFGKIVIEYSTYGKQGRHVVKV
jgi:hypothetical protein